MRIGYGYKRRDKEFDAWECERVFVDTPATERMARRDLFLCLQPGDVLFMFRPGDLGYGRELKNLRAILKENGVSIEYPPSAPDGRGRPAKFNPTPEDDKYLRVLWKDQTLSVAYVLRVASEKTGADVQRHQLIHRYGKAFRVGRLMPEIYRIYGNSNELLYIGACKNMRRRIYVHQVELPAWLGYAALISRRWYLDLQKAKAIEARAIRMLRPEFNAYHQIDQAQRLRAARGKAPLLHRPALPREVRAIRMREIRGQVYRQDLTSGRKALE